MRALEDIDAVMSDRNLRTDVERASALGCSLRTLQSAKRRWREDDHSSGVYFIRAAGGPIKIGWTKDVTTRFYQLQCGSYEDLTLVALFLSTDTRDERRVHAAFDAERIRGEWFQPSAALTAYIATAALPGERRLSAAQAAARSRAEKHTPTSLRARREHIPILRRLPTRNMRIRMFPG